MKEKKKMPPEIKRAWFAYQEISKALWGIRFSDQREIKRKSGSYAVFEAASPPRDDWYLGLFPRAESRHRGTRTRVAGSRTPYRLVSVDLATVDG